MAYIQTDRRSELDIRQDDLLASKKFVVERKPDTYLFYELEEAVVLDIIMDENHPQFSEKFLNADDSPPNIDGSMPSDDQNDYGVIGTIKFRFLRSERNKEKEVLNWAYPIENTGIVEWPLLNETVIIAKHLNKFYYSKKLNFKSVVNSNASFITEIIAGKVKENINEYTGKPYDGPKSKLNFEGGQNYTGVLGKYFKFNHHIRALRKYEGDTILQSRFGSSIRFGAYDDVRKNDNGIGEYQDGGGNPMILIRNRQAPIKNKDGFSPKSLTLEDINKDGTSIHITSGKTISKFKSEIKTPMVSGEASIPLPKLDGDQVIINSDRIIMSSRANELILLSKKKMGMISDDTISISSGIRITLSAPEGITFNTPQMFFGDHAKVYEPAMLGRSTVAWLNSMCDWLLSNINSQIAILTAIIGHTHTTEKGPTLLPLLPPSLAIFALQLESLKAQQISVLAMQAKLSELLSSRVFVSGGDD